MLGSHELNGVFFLDHAVNSVDDFCVFAPPDPGPGSVIGNTEVCLLDQCIIGVI